MSKTNFRRKFVCIYSFYCINCLPYIIAFAFASQSSFVLCCVAMVDRYNSVLVLPVVLPVVPTNHKSRHFFIMEWGNTMHGVLYAVREQNRRTNSLLHTTGYDHWSLLSQKQYNSKELFGNKNKGWSALWSSTGFLFMPSSRYPSCPQGNNGSTGTTGYRITKSYYSQHFFCTILNDSKGQSNKFVRA